MNIQNAKKLIAEYAKTYFQATNDLSNEFMTENANSIKGRIKHDLAPLSSSQKVDLFADACAEFNKIFSSTSDCYSAKEIENHTLAHMKLIVLGFVMNAKEKELAQEKLLGKKTKERE